MNIRFENDYSKIWLARKGPYTIFGKDVDQRERLNDSEAIKWFDDTWRSKLEAAVRTADSCTLDYVRSNVPLYAQKFISGMAKHRRFKLGICQFICQLTDESTCDQLWFIPSTSGDPRTLYVNFATVPIKEEFDSTAQILGWKPEKLAEKILLDFMESVNHTNHRDSKGEVADFSDI